MHVFPYHIQPRAHPVLGLIALQADERIEADFRRLLPADVDFMVSRVPSGRDVTPESLARMEADLPQAAALLPGAMHFDVIAYGCTSGSAQIGPARVAEQVRAGAQAMHVTDPVSALVAACSALGLHRLALLSPYVERVSDRLREALSDQGVATPAFGSFAESEESRVVQITPDSIVQAAEVLAGTGEVDGLFLSCTNLNTLPVIGRLEQETGLPVLSSNLVLAWHMLQLTGAGTPDLDCALARADRRAGAVPA